MPGNISLPTKLDDWRLVGRTVRLVFTLPAYLALGVIAWLIGLIAIVVSQNFSLVLDVIIGGSLPVGARVETFGLLFPFVGPAFEPLSGILIIVTAVLFGCNIALLVYHLREHSLSIKGGSGSAIGVLFGILGAGCAACGPVVFAGILSLLGATSLFFLLPLEGLEFALFAVGMLLISMFWLSDGMRGGEIAGCPVTIEN